MKTLDVQSLPVNKKTIQTITEFVYSNRNDLGDRQKMFYADLKGLIDIQLKKPRSLRLTMDQICERAYNIEQHILAAGAASVTTQFIKL